MVSKILALIDFVVETIKRKMNKIMHPDNCYLEYHLIVDHRRYIAGSSETCLFVCLFEKQDFAIPNWRNLVQTKERLKPWSSVRVAQMFGPSQT